MPHLIRRLFFGIAIGALGAAGIDALAAGNVIPSTSADAQTRVVTVQDLAPPVCAGIALDTLVVGTGSVNGTSGNDLLIGSAGLDLLDGTSGDDCIVAGDGDDTLDGGSGAEVLLAGGGTDALDGEAHSDTCHGGGQAGDTFNKCEFAGP